MVRKEDSTISRTTDRTVTLVEMQRFVNLVAGALPAPYTVHYPYSAHLPSVHR